MDETQIREVIATYRALLAQHGLGARECPVERLPENEDEVLEQAMWMLEQMELHLAESGSWEDRAVRERAMRWLGFIQCALWTTGYRSIAEMMVDNTPRGSG